MNNDSLTSMPTQLEVSPASAQEVLPFRTRLRQELKGQIVHDSIHRREGWTRTYQLAIDGSPVGFGSIAIGGPWKGKPTIFEFYLAPDHRTRAFAAFEILLAASEARFFEVQSSDALLTALALTYGSGIETEKVVFHDGRTTSHPANGAALRRLTDEEEIRACLERRQGGGEWELELDGQVAGKGGVLFHYNRPYGDIYMEIGDAHRRRGLGAYLVQELKRACYELGAVPCARCNPTNVPSRRTLQKAGFVPFAHILRGALPTLSSGADQTTLSAP